MRSKAIVLVIACTLCVITSGEIQGPPSDSGDPKTSYKDRKSNLIDNDDDDRNSRGSDNKNKHTINEIHDKSIETSGETLEALLEGAAIKIIKGPDFTQEKEAQKMTEMLSTLVNSHAKLIKKLEDEIEEMDGSIASLGEQPEEVQTQEELQLQLLYEAAMKILNRTRSDKTEGFALLKQAAEKGHAEAQAKIAWAQLMGNFVEMDFDAARVTFLKLADTGLPDAHMVHSTFILLNLPTLNFIFAHCFQFYLFLLCFIVVHFCGFVGFGLYVCRWNWFQCEPGKSFTSLHNCSLR